MTRINCGIPSAELVDMHLLAEHREIKRIPNCIKKGKYKLDNIPDNFKLGTGHVKFFYNKLKYLHRRYISLYLECRARGFNVTNFEECFDNLPKELYNEYVPTPKDRLIIRKRINLRIKEYNFKKNKTKKHD